MKKVLFTIIFLLGSIGICQADMQWFDADQMGDPVCYSGIAAAANVIIATEWQGYEENEQDIYNWLVERFQNGCNNPSFAWNKWFEDYQVIPPIKEKDKPEIVVETFWSHNFEELDELRLYGWGITLNLSHDCDRQTVTFWNSYYQDNEIIGIFVTNGNDIGYGLNYIGVYEYDGNWFLWNYLGETWKIESYSAMQHRWHMYYPLK